MGDVVTGRTWDIPRGDDAAERDTTSDATSDEALVVAAQADSAAFAPSALT